MNRHAAMLISAAAFAAAAPLFPLPAGAFSVNGGEYTLETSVIDNGGGSQLNGGEYSSRGALGQTSLPAGAGPAAAGEYVNRAGFYDPPHFLYQGGQSAALNMQSGDVRLNIPANSVDKRRFDISIIKDASGAAPSGVDQAKIDEANNKMTRNEGGWSQLFPNHLTELTIFDETGYFDKPLANKGVMTIRYRDADNDGLLDGSSPPVRIDTLNAWTLDTERNIWVRLPDAGADPAQKTVTVYFGRPGVYAILGAMDDAVRDVFAFPVPFRPNGPAAGAGQGQTGVDGSCAGCGITFNNVPQTGDIEIYTLDGRLVRKLSISENLDQMNQQVRWNARTSGGERAASGVYLWRAVSGSNSKTGKLMIIW